MPDYALSKIYCIRNVADNDKIVYIGSTTQTLSNRMSGHRNDAPKRQSMFYSLMTTVGVSNFHIELIKDFPCERKEQLLAEEGRFIRMHRDGALNERIAGRKWEEWYVDNREKRLEGAKTYYASHTEERKTYGQEYREKNQDKLTASKKAYNDANKEAIFASKKAYRDANKAKAKAYREAHKEEIAAKAKEYMEAHKDEILERRRELRALKMQSLVNGASPVVS